MTLVSIVGDVGSGKTLFSTYIATGDSRPIYSNYKLKLKKYHDLKPETLNKLKEQSLVIIDEAYTWLESRLSGRNINLYLSYILFQSRKRGLDIILTDQLEGTIDLRFRQLTNYEIQCQNVDDGFAYDIYKVSSYHQYKPMRFVMPFSIAETLFPLYDSWELINPIDDNLLFNVSEDKGDIMKEIDVIVATLLKKANANQYSKGIISDYCIRNKHPKTYIDLIYNAIKSTEVFNNK